MRILKDIAFLVGMVLVIALFVIANINLYKISFSRDTNKDIIDKPCPNGQVKFNNKCYIPGKYYSQYGNTF